MDERLLAYLERYITPERKAKIAERLRQRTRHITVAFEDIYKEHNISAALRSCEAFGIQDIHLLGQRETGDAMKPHRGIAFGAGKWIDLYHHPDPQTGLKTLKENGYRIVAASPHETSCTLEHFSIDRKSAFVFGNEKEGLSKAVEPYVDQTLHIPMVGFTESLNVSVCVGIVLQRVAHRVRRSDDLPWRLSEQEQTALRLRWVKNSLPQAARLQRRFEENDRLTKPFY